MDDALLRSSCDNDVPFFHKERLLLEARRLSRPCEDATQNHPSSYNKINVVQVGPIFPWRTIIYQDRRRCSDTAMPLEQ